MARSAHPGGLSHGNRTRPPRSPDTGSNPRADAGSPAARAGIQAGDLIVEAAGKPITDGDELVEALAAAGDTFEVKVVRGTEERTVSVGGGEATGEA